MSLANCPVDFSINTKINGKQETLSLEFEKLPYISHHTPLPYASFLYMCKLTRTLHYCMIRRREMFVDNMCDCWKKNRERNDRDSPTIS